jgi:hypothetical protein
VRAREALWLAVLAVSAAVARPTTALAEVIASGIEFIPPLMNTGDPNRSRIAVRGPALIFNDGSTEPLKRTSRTGGTVTPLATFLGTPLAVAVRGEYAYSVSSCAVFRTPVSRADALVLARVSTCLSGTADSFESVVAVDDVSVYYATYTGIWTILKVPIAGGPPIALVTTDKALRGLATDGTYLYWSEERFPDPGGPQSSVRRVPVGGGPAVDLATGLKAMRGGLALHGTEVVFADANQFDTYRVMKVSVTGGSVTTLATVTSADQPTDIAADDSRVYWTIKGAVRAVPIGGGAAQTLFGGLDEPANLTLDSGAIYWTEILCCAIHGNGVVKRAPLAGGPVTVLAQGRDWPGEIVVDALRAYWVEGGIYGTVEGYGRILTLPLAGGSPSSIADSGPGKLPAFAVDDTHVYFANKWTVKRVPLDGGPVEQLGRGYFNIDQLVTDGSHVYWVETPQAIVYRVSVNGGPVTLVGAGLGPSATLDLDATNVYWVDHYDTIRKAPKAGGATVVLAGPLPFFSEIVTDGIDVHFVEDDSGAAGRIPVGGGATSPTTGTEVRSQVSLALDQQDLYWIGQETIARAPKTGGSSVPIAGGLASSILVPNGLATDGRGGVYWTEALGGTVKARFGIPPVTSLAFASTGETALEGASASARVQLTTASGGPLASPVTVQYATVDGSAVAGQDYVPASGTLTIPAGTPSGTLLPITVMVLDDALDEDEEAFSIVLANAAGAALEAPSSHTIAIVDADPPPSVSAADCIALEGTGTGGSCALAASLSAPSGRAVTVSYATQDVTAVAPADYAAASGSVTFAPGVVTRPIPVALAGDALDEVDETFRLVLSSPVNATLGIAQAQATIDDDDGPSLLTAPPSVVEGDAGTTPATFTLSLSAASVQAVTIGFTTADGTAVAPFDYLPVSGTITFPPGTTSRDLDVPVVGDVLDEPNERFHLLLGPVVDGVPSVDSVPATIQDDDGGMVSLQELEHGADRREALETAAPDLFVLHEPARTSWEAIVDGASGDLGPGTGPLFERLDAGLTTVVQSSAAVGTGPARVLRWSNASGSPHDGYLRVASDGCTSDCGADDVYRLRAYETTARVPRFNASGQTTVLVLQNVTGSVVAGTAFFWDPAGAVLGSHVFTLPAHATLVLNCSLVPGVAGRSGSITVVHDGGYGGLAGKAVALEPGAGFSFDTPLTYRPR